MKLQLVALVNSGMSLEDAKIFANDPEAAIAHSDTLLEELGYEGDLEDEEEIGEFLNELEDENVIYEDFELVDFLSPEAIKTFQGLEEWAKKYTAPDFIQLCMALTELKSLL